MVYAEEWPEVFNLVQSVLNNSLSTRLKKRTQMQVFTGHEETTPLALMLKDQGFYSEAQRQDARVFAKLPDG
jgi:hypothetical protein